MPSVFEIARRHVSLPVSTDVVALKRVLRDWLHYTESLPLQEKPTHPAALDIAVYRYLKPITHSPPDSNEAFLRLRPSSETRKPVVAATARDGVRVYTKRVPMRLWTAVLPWEVQRGLSCSELRLPHLESSTTDETVNTPNESEADQSSKVSITPASREESDVQVRKVVTSPNPLSTPHTDDGNTEDVEEDPFGVVTVRHTTLSSSTALRTSMPPISSPGMFFVMDAQSAAAEGLCFWSGAILQPIDIAFIAPVEPTATSTPSFQELRETLRMDREGGAKGGGYDRTRFFPNDELDSPTVRFAVQSHAHLDPFPNCDRTDAKVNPSSREEEGEEERVEQKGRRHIAQPEGVSGAALRYVLETTRHLLRDGIADALRESQSHQAGSSVEAEAVECTITLELPDALRDELREKARLYTNYVIPLSEHIRHHLRQISNAPPTALRNEVSHAMHPNSLVAIDASTSAASPGRRLASRSPMLMEEADATPHRLVPSIVGKHEAPALRHDITSAAALARYPQTHPHMPIPPPIDYELFELCLRLGVCQRDAIYYYYGRILREWRMELQRVKKNGSMESSITEEDTRRMLRLVRDPSLQVPEELSACVEAVARCRGAVNGDAETNN